MEGPADGRELFTPPVCASSSRLATRLRIRTVLAAAAVVAVAVLLGSPPRIDARAPGPLSWQLDTGG